MLEDFDNTLPAFLTLVILAVKYSYRIFVDSRRSGAGVHDNNNDDGLDYGSLANGKLITERAQVSCARSKMPWTADAVPVITLSGLNDEHVGGRTGPGDVS